MSNLKYWIWLTSRGTMAGQGAYSLWQKFGSPEAVYSASEEDYDKVEKLPKAVRKALGDKSLLEAEKVLEKCKRMGIDILTIADEYYPDRLRQIADPPCVLYVKGRLPKIDEELCIAMVGSRKATKHGVETGKLFARELTRQGAIVVTGSAAGIDSAAIMGAVEAGGPVISVLGNGIDMVYPPGHEKVYRSVADFGVLISEHPPGTGPVGMHFPVRNRILSGLSLGTLVVEAAERSGTLITARLALEQNRDVFAIPGDWDALTSRGANHLIQQGEAKLTMGTWDILEEYQHSYPHKIRVREESAVRPDKKVSVRVKPVGDKKVPSRKPSPEVAVPVAVETKKKALNLKDDPQAVTDDERELLRHLDKGDMTAEELIEKTGLAARRVMSAMTMLQIRKMVEETKPGRFESKVSIIL